MSRDEQQFLSIGYHKGEMDFRVNYSVSELTYKQMKELREMTIVGIGRMERMWATAQEKKREPPNYPKTIEEAVGKVV
ncbi:MAG TPA: hypothetical protein ENH20_01490 [Candidatus Pacearchaeota archaeon]|nr:hypothetical protein [Candidatus Pacearchaeota archaeon]